MDARRSQELLAQFERSLAIFEDELCSVEAEEKVVKAAWLARRTRRIRAGDPMEFRSLA